MIREFHTIRVCQAIIPTSICGMLSNYSSFLQQLEALLMITLAQCNKVETSTMITDVVEDEMTAEDDMVTKIVTMIEERTTDGRMVGEQVVNGGSRTTTANKEQIPAIAIGREVLNLTMNLKLARGNEHAAPRSRITITR